MLTDNIAAYPHLYKLVNERYSCRKYQSTPVTRDVLKAVLDVARLAPSACNRQPWTFLVADTPELTAKAAAAYGRDWAESAPAFIIACGHHADAWHREYDGKDHTDVDIAIAVEHLCLAAASLGLGTCWICNFDPAKLSQSFDFPAGVEPIAMVSIGYPAADAPVPAKRRKDLDEIVRWGKF